MCSYKTWFYEERYGYVIECGKCKKLQVGFGNLLLTLNTAEFGNFRERIMFEQGKVQKGVAENVKHIFITTPCEGVTLLLNNAEIKELCHMLDEADSEMKIARLLELFEEKI